MEWSASTSTSGSKLSSNSAGSRRAKARESRRGPSILLGGIRSPHDRYRLPRHRPRIMVPLGATALQDSIRTPRLLADADRSQLRRRRRLLGRNPEALLVGGVELGP